MKEDLIKIINHYGIKHQLKHLQTEMFELIDAILELLYFHEYHPTDASAIVVNGDRYTIKEYIKKLEKHIEEEYSDVTFMLEQIKELYGLKDDNIRTWHKFKGNRQLKRMENECTGE